jgi:hypothetical protein
MQIKNLYFFRCMLINSLRNKFKFVVSNALKSFSKIFFNRKFRFYFDSFYFKKMQFKYIFKSIILNSCFYYSIKFVSTESPIFSNFHLLSNFFWSKKSTEFLCFFNSIKDFKLLQMLNIKTYLRESQQKLFLIKQRFSYNSYFLKNKIKIASNLRLFLKIERFLLYLYVFFFTVFLFQLYSNLCIFIFSTIFVKTNDYR